MKDKHSSRRPPDDPPEDPGEITIEFVDHEEPPAKVESDLGSLGAIELEAEASEASPAADDQAKKIAHLEDQLLRLRAEFANFRHRVERDRAEYLRQAKAEATAGLLPVLDDLDRAVQALEPEVPEHFAQGLVLLRQHMLEALRRLGLEEIDAVGEPFDPTQHEAVNAVRREDVPPMTVTAVHARGYRLGGKVLKPARVEVSNGPDEGGFGENDG